LSHIPQRKEKDCLNCGTIVQGKYCQNCGQENVVPHETFWHMVKHFLYDITHFDSKFFDSMKYLLLRPGFLPQEYIKGRRASYLNPVKKYVFTSAVFFLIFFSFFFRKNPISFNVSDNLTKSERTSLKERIGKRLQEDTANMTWKAAWLLINDTTRVVTHADMAPYELDSNVLKIGSRSYRNLSDYDSIQAMLPTGEKDGWLKSLAYRKTLGIREKYKNEPGTALDKLSKTFLHKLPYLLFVSLPLFALILKLLYIRHKNIYYADHGIFTIYHYIFSFILLLIVFGLDKLNDLIDSGFIDFLVGVLFLSGGFYLYKAMRKFYKQRRAKTIFKFLLLNLSAFIMMMVLFVVFILFSVFEI
jgi:hypothetical protein